jgi:hypothetical protein|tara:strand:+ start:33 stop:515 length:483 start_codon:yes stop_codon:yes gene_type:complete
MKKFLWILLIGFVFLNSCAKPTVVDSVMPGDEELNCGQLKNAVAESQRFIREAESVKGGTGGNITRGLLFWPAIIGTYNNANEAIAAANTRKVHLFNIMRRKDCKGLGELVVETTTMVEKGTNISEDDNLSQELKNLNELHKSGALTDEEFTQAKKKLLN